MKLSETVDAYRSEIERWVYFGRADWSKLMARIREVEIDRESDYYDEQVWTFLVACGYAAAGKKGLLQFYEEIRLPFTEGNRIWFEVLPLPPRSLEGNTNLDLALGAITTRKGTKSGIEYDASQGSGIAFFEFKWYSDISTVTSHDLHRNQLARVIDTAITFQSSEGKAPDNVQVILVSPRAYKERKPPSRLYSYKFEEYSSTEALLADLRATPASVNVLHDYSDLISVLELKWQTYEDLIAAMPSTNLRDALVDFAAAYAPILSEV